MNRIALAFAAMCLAGPVTAQTAPTLVEVSTKAREARLKGDIPTWLDYATKTLALTPDHPDILISVARAHAAAGNKAEAADHLAQAARRGAGIDPGRLAEFKPLAGTPQFDSAAAAIKRNLSPVAKATVFAEVPDSEGIAYDPVSKRLFSGTEGELYSVGMDGKVASFAKGGGLRQVLGMKVDAQRRLLWAVSGRYPELGPSQRPDVGTGGIRAYNIDTGALVTSVEVDERPTWVHGFNDMGLAADGTVYVTDTNTHALYRLAPGGKALELVLRDTAMTFPNGIVMSPDGRTLYIAHVEGISAIDLASRTRRLLGVPADGSVNSIDGLLLKDGIFYGVQNSPYMLRIVAARLASDGQSISKVWTVNSRTPLGYNQTTAAIADNDLYMVGGTPTPDIYGGTNTAPPMRRIWKVPLGG